MQQGQSPFAVTLQPFSAGYLPARGQLPATEQELQKRRPVTSMENQRAATGCQLHVIGRCDEGGGETCTTRSAWL